MINAVISDTDIIVHMVKGDIFTQVVPLLLDKVYITPKVEEELMGAKKDKISWSDAGEHYNKVKQSCLPRLPEFSYQIDLFERNLMSHSWVISYLN